MNAPRAAQVAATKAVVAWYVRHHYEKASDPGVVDMFCDPDRVGAFVIEREALRKGNGDALFRLLVATSMFQRLRDTQILNILRGIQPEDAAELTDSRRLLRLVDESPCGHMRTIESLVQTCNLTKDPSTRVGCCEANPDVECHMKRHTVLLKRYGHFGKVPTSLALVLRETGANDLGTLRRSVLRRVRNPLARAVALEAELSRAWRVNQKIASMFLSAVTNPDLSRGLAPWTPGIDWTYYVVIDSNVDLFLGSIGYQGGSSYDSRRAFVRAISSKIDLEELHPALQSFNPRIVQQAMYLFMSSANRRVAVEDCMHVGHAACAACPRPLRARCPVTRSAQGRRGSAEVAALK